ncbi:hypothetical protein [Nodosilinea nodulosa]|uniref:hypothetical protein n=1 Tax=Nodosilinea nodulosa TaxID=416001 RepID=UPI00031961EA|nr:hypothetical protein [Nodosilinea nodulosa]
MNPNPFPQAISLSTSLDNAYNRYLEIQEALETAEDPTLYEDELAGIQTHLAILADSAEDFLIQANDTAEALDAQAAVLLEKAERIKAQAEARKAKAAWINGLMHWFVSTHFPKGVQTDEGKFFLKSSESVEVLPETQDRIGVFQRRLQDLLENCVYSAVPVDPEAFLDEFKDISAYGISCIKVSVKPDKVSLKKILKDGEYRGFAIKKSTTLSLSKPRKTKAK